MKRVVFLLLVAASVFTLSAATNALDTSGAAPPPSAPAKKGAAELEKLVEPIALHPDPLIAIILPASAYPLEVVQAARFVKDTNNIAKLGEQPWDDNVKAVAEFPALISKMDADLTWTTELGQAFIDQPKELMDAIQSLRNKAQTAGTLKTSEQQIVVVTNVIEQRTVEQQVVVVTNTIVQIQPSNPQVIYVPTYPPTVYYPPPTYVYDPYAPLIAFGVGIAFGAIIANNCDWHGGCVYHHDYHGDVNVNVDRNVNRNVNRNTGARPTPYSGNRTGGTKWQPDQNRLRSSGAPPSAQTREARGWGGGAQASQLPAGGAGAGGARPSQMPAAGAGGARPSQLPAAGAGGARPSQTPSSGAGRFGPQQPGYQQPSAGTTPARSQGAGQGARPGQQPSAGARPAQTPSVNRAPSQGASAFGGANSSNARNASNRGAASRGGGGGGGRGGGGRGGGGRR